MSSTRAIGAANPIWKWSARLVAGFLFVFCAAMGALYYAPTTVVLNAFERLLPPLAVVAQQPMGTLGAGSLELSPATTLTARQPPPLQVHWQWHPWQLLELKAAFTINFTGALTGSGVVNAQFQTLSINELAIKGDLLALHAWAEGRLPLLALTTLSGPYQLHGHWQISTLATHAPPATHATVKNQQGAIAITLKPVTPQSGSLLATHQLSLSASGEQQLDWQLAEHSALSSSDTIIARGKGRVLLTQGSGGPVNPQRNQITLLVAPSAQPEAKTKALALLATIGEQSADGRILSW